MVTELTQEQYEAFTDAEWEHYLLTNEFPIEYKNYGRINKKIRRDSKNQCG